MICDTNKIIGGKVAECKRKTEKYSTIRRRFLPAEAIFANKNDKIMKKAVIIGATSGLGLETARLLHGDGWTVGLMGRRIERLEAAANKLKERVFTKVVDIRDKAADQQLIALIGEIGGVDLVFHVAGIGKQNMGLTTDIELSTVETNALGFTRMVTAAFNHFADKGHGHIAVVSSIAGTKGLGAAPAYSATKRFQNTYIQCLAQQSKMRGLDIAFTDIRPGFVDTDLLKGGHYPMLMQPSYVAKHIVKALYRRKRKVVIDWRYTILTFFWQLIPDCIWERLPIKS